MSPPIHDQTARVMVERAMLVSAYRVPAWAFDGPSLAQQELHNAVEAVQEHKVYVVVDPEAEQRKIADPRQGTLVVRASAYGRLKEKLPTAQPTTFADTAFSVAMVPLHELNELGAVTFSTDRTFSPYTLDYGYYRTYDLVEAPLEITDAWQRIQREITLAQQKAVESEKEQQKEGESMEIKSLGVNIIIARKVVADSMMYGRFTGSYDGLVGDAMHRVLESEDSTLLEEGVIYIHNGKLMTRASAYILTSHNGQTFADTPSSVAMVGLDELVRLDAVKSAEKIVHPPSVIAYTYLDLYDLKEVAPEVTQAWQEAVGRARTWSDESTGAAIVTYAEIEEEYDVDALRAMSMDTTPGASGRSSNYYMVEVKTVTTKYNRRYFAECNDLIRALKMSFAQGNIFKAIWRFCASENLGKAKANNEAIRDLEKIIFFAEQEIARLKGEQEEG